MAPDTGCNQPALMEHIPQVFDVQSQLQPQRPIEWMSKAQLCQYKLVYVKPDEHTIENMIRAVIGAPSCAMGFSGFMGGSGLLSQSLPIGRPPTTGW